MQQVPPSLAKRAAQLAAESGIRVEAIIEQALCNGLIAWEQEYRLIEKSLQQAHHDEFAGEGDTEQVRNVADEN